MKVFTWQNSINGTRMKKIGKNSILSFSKYFVVWFGLFWSIIIIVERKVSYCYLDSSSSSCLVFRNYFVIFYFLCFLIFFFIFSWIKCIDFSHHVHFITILIQIYAIVIMTIIMRVIQKPVVIRIIIILVRKGQTNILIIKTQ